MSPGRQRRCRVGARRRGVALPAVLLIVSMMLVTSAASFEAALLEQRNADAVADHLQSFHAADAAMAIENARELYTRRNEGVSLWVVPSALITASSPDEKDPLFDPAQDKVYRHASFYELPPEVGHM